MRRAAVPAARYQPATAPAAADARDHPAARHLCADLGWLRRRLADSRDGDPRPRPDDERGLPHDAWLFSRAGRLAARRCPDDAARGKSAGAAGTTAAALDATNQSA